MTITCLLHPFSVQNCGKFMSTSRLAFVRYSPLLMIIRAEKNEGLMKQNEKYHNNKITDLISCYKYFGAYSTTTLFLVLSMQPKKAIKYI